MRNHYYFLDFLRGLAALAVCLFHASSLTHVLLFGHAYLAVDFFFMLSGFVLTLSHENKGTFGQFVISRVIRLYPMVLAAVAIGFIGLSIRKCLEPDFTVAASDLITALILNGLLIPGPDATGFNNALFPANPVLWSLFFELLANLVWWVFLRQRLRRLLIAMAFSGLTVAALGIVNGTIEVGYSWGLVHAITGFARALFGFCVGALIFLYRPRLLAEAERLPHIVVLIFLLVVSGPHQAGNPLLYDLIGLFLLLPAVLYSAAAMPEGKDNGLWRMAGRISYPLYTLHFPVLAISYAVTSALGFDLGMGFYAIVLMTVIAAHETAKRYDEPMRRKLSGLRSKYLPQGADQEPAVYKLS